MKDKTPFDFSRVVKCIAILALTIQTGAQASTVSDQVTLEWDPPTTRTDGSLLSDIIGYRVYYGTSSGAYGMSIEASAETISITDLISTLNPEEGAAYYFAVTAMDDTGKESPYSEEFSWRWFSTPHTLNYPTPLWWLEQYGITNAQEDVVGTDLDGDGLDVWEEYIMDSDPTDPTSQLAVMNTPHFENENPAGRIIGNRLEWRGSTQRIYTVESSADLQSWLPVPELEHIEPSSDWIVATHLNANDDPLMYRVRVRLR